MTTIEFFVPGEAHGRDERSQPFTAGGKARVRVYTTAEGRNWRRNIAVYALLQPDRPREPFQGAVTMTLVFVRERPKSHYLGGDRTRELNALGRRTPRPLAKPDLGNCEKPVEDALKEARYYRDDAQVVSRHGIKQWADPGAQPGVHVTVRFHDDADDGGDGNE